MSDMGEELMLFPVIVGLFGAGLIIIATVKQFRSDIGKNK